MMTYTQSSAAIKRALENARAGTAAPNELKAARSFVAALDKLSIRNPTQQAPLYRGIDMSAEELQQLASSKEVQLKNLASTTYLPEKALEFARERPALHGTEPVVLAFDHAAKGSPKFPSAEHFPGNIAALDHEAEVVLPEGGVFEVKDVQHADGVTIVRLAQTGHEPVPAMRVKPSRWNLGANTARAESMQFKALKSSVPAEGATVGEFAASIGKDPAAVRMDLRRLAADGLITLTPEGDDLRIRVLPEEHEVTKPGRMLLGVGLGLGVSTAAGQSRAAEPPSPAQPPAHVYREALQAVDGGAKRIIDSSADSIVRSKARKGKSGVMAFGGKNLERAVVGALDALDALSSDPQRIVEQLSGSVGQLPRTHPSAYMAMVQRSSQIVGYLRSVAPARSAPSLLHPDGAPPSLDEQLDFAARFVGATQPRQAMRDIAAATATPEEVEAFRSNWGERWDDLRATVLGSVMRLAQAGRPIDNEHLRRLDGLLDMNGQLDPSAAPQVTTLMLQAQDAYAAKAAGQQGSGKASSKPMANAFQTRLAGVAQDSHQ